MSKNAKRKLIESRNNKVIIYNVGSINIDHVYRVSHLVKTGETLSSTDYQSLLGGKGANQSIALAKAGASVKHIGRYHHLDKWVKKVLKEAGVDCSLLQTTDVPTGHAIIQVDDEGRNSIILYSGANHSFSKSDIEHALQSAQQGDWLLLQNESNQLGSAIALASTKGLKLAINTAPMNNNIFDLPLNKFEIIITNEVEASALFGLPEAELIAIADLINAGDLINPHFEVINRLIKKLCPNTTVVITLGEKGAMGWNGNQWYFSPASVVAVVDTTAAGDTFTGYLVNALSQDNTLIASMDMASKASALCIQKSGASSSIPSLDEVNLEMDNDNGT